MVDEKTYDESVERKEDRDNYKPEDLRSEGRKLSPEVRKTLGRVCLRPTHPGSFPGGGWYDFDS